MAEGFLLDDVRGCGEPGSPSRTAALRRDFLLDGGATGGSGAGSGPAAPAPVIRLDNASNPRPIGPAVIAIGAFDGVHAGHRELIARTVADARSRGAAAVAVTFDPDPDVVISPHPAAKLMTVADRLAELSRTGLDAVLAVPFTRDVAALGPADFFDKVLAPAVDVKAVHVGSNFRLGAGGRADVPALRAWLGGRGVPVTGHELVRDEGETVSATRIRALLGTGDLDAANRELGRHYMVRGIVVHGRGQGTGLGFPTANVERRGLIQMPRDGVYAGWALTSEGVAYPAAINVGLPPMFAGDPNSSTLEATLIGFSGDLYDRPLAVSFTELLRPPASFPSLDALIDAVKGNLADVAERFGEHGVDLRADHADAASINAEECA